MLLMCHACMWSARVHVCVCVCCVLALLNTLQKDIRLILQGSNSALLLSQLMVALEPYVLIELFFFIFTADHWLNLFDNIVSVVRRKCIYRYFCKCEIHSIHFFFEISSFGRGKVLSHRKVINVNCRHSSKYTNFRNTVFFIIVIIVVVGPSKIAIILFRNPIEHN